MKKVRFQLHWFFDISVGPVLALMGVTGITLSFQDKLMRALSPDVLVVQECPEGMLPLDELVRRIEGTEPGRKVASVWAEMNSDKTGRIFYTPLPGQRHGEPRWADPYAGAFVGEPRGKGFFNLMIQLHRFLVMGEYGKQVIVACVLILIFFCLSGLYLRWSRRVLD